MRFLPLVLSATLAAFGGVAHAANRDVTDFLDRANAVATAELRAAGVTTDNGLTFRARVGSDGRLSNAHVVTSSGSLETDRRAEHALRRLRVATPPDLLVGANVKIAIGADPMQQAKLP